MLFVNPKISQYRSSLAHSVSRPFSLQTLRSAFQELGAETLGALPQPRPPLWTQPTSPFKDTTLSNSTCQAHLTQAPFLPGMPCLHIPHPVSHSPYFPWRPPWVYDTIWFSWESCPERVQCYRAKCRIESNNPITYCTNSLGQIV